MPITYDTVKDAMEYLRTRGLAISLRKIKALLPDPGGSLDTVNKYAKQVRAEWEANGLDTGAAVAVEEEGDLEKSLVPEPLVDSYQAQLDAQGVLIEAETYLQTFLGTLAALTTTRPNGRTILSEVEHLLTARSIQAQRAAGVRSMLVDTQSPMRDFTWWFHNHVASGQLVDICSHALQRIQAALEGGGGDGE